VVTSGDQMAERGGSQGSDWKGREESDTLLPGYQRLRVAFEVLDSRASVLLPCLLLQTER